MDIVTIMKKRNTEYLKLIHDGQSAEKKLSKKLSDIVKEINQITNLYATQIELVSKELDEKIEKAISQNEEDVRGTLIALKRKKNSISKNEEQRQIDVKATYGFNCRRSSDKKDMIYNLLFKGTPFDANGKIVVKSTTDFVAVEDTQTQVKWVVYESDGKKGVGEDANWMEYGSNENKNGMQVTVQIPPEYLGRACSYSHWITFSLDNNGILEIIITDKDGKRVGYDKKQI